MIKKKLKQILYLDAKINSKIRQLETLKEQRGYVQAIDYSKDKVQTSTTSFGDLLDKIVDLEMEIASEIEALIDKKKSAKKLLASLDIPDSLVMEMRYLEGCTWYEIATALNYSQQSVYRIHGLALLKLKDESKLE